MESFIQADITRDLYVGQNTTGMTIEFWMKLTDWAWKNPYIKNKSIVTVQALGGNSTLINKNREVLAISTDSNGTFNCKSLDKYKLMANSTNETI